MDNGNDGLLTSRFAVSQSVICVRPYRSRVANRRKASPARFIANRSTDFVKPQTLIRQYTGDVRPRSRGHLYRSHLPVKPEYGQNRCQHSVISSVIRDGLVSRPVAKPATATVKSTWSVGKGVEKPQYQYTPDHCDPTAMPAVRAGHAWSAGCQRRYSPSRGAKNDYTSHHLRLYTTEISRCLLYRKSHSSLTDITEKASWILKRRQTIYPSSSAHATEHR